MITTVTILTGPQALLLELAGHHRRECRTILMADRAAQDVPQPIVERDGQAYRFRRPHRVDGGWRVVVQVVQVVPLELAEVSEAWGEVGTLDVPAGTPCLTLCWQSYDPRSSDEANGRLNDYYDDNPGLLGRLRQRDADDAQPGGRRDFEEMQRADFEAFSSAVHTRLPGTAAEEVLYRGTRRRAAGRSRAWTDAQREAIRDGIRALRKPRGIC